MKNLVSKAIAIGLSVSLAIVATACNTGSPLKEDPLAVEGESAEAKKITLITWTNEGTLDALNEINSKFTEKTGIEVVVEDVPSAEYEDFLKERLKEGQADIFSYTSDSKAFAQPATDWAPSELLTWEAIIADGHALDLRDYSFMNNWNLGGEACSYKGGIYGVATGMTIMNGMFYNKKLFDEHGLSEPTSYNELIELCEQLKAEGIAPITVGGKDTWPVQMLTNAIVDTVTEGRGEELCEGLWRGNRTFTDPESMEIYNRENQILSYMEEGYLDVPYDGMAKHFTDGNAAMLYAGSWNAADIEKADKDFEYGYFAIPGNDKHNFTVKYDLTLGINANSANKPEAVKWLEFFSQPDIYKIYIDKNGFVPTMPKISTDNEFLNVIKDRTNDATRTFECYNRVPSNIGPYGTYDLINFSAAGGVFDTPEEFAEEAQKQWDEALHELGVK